MEYTMTPVQPEGNAPLTSEVIYAGFWRRVGSFLLDGLIIGTPVSLVSSAIAMGRHLNFTADLTKLQLAFGIPLAFFYFTLLESSKLQATLGKLAVNTRVTDLKGNRISFGRASVRFLGHFLSAIILYIGFIIMLFNKKRQTMHDNIAGTLVMIGRTV
jgi:uncharacterized RDD family membrane protein YckC